MIPGTIPRGRCVPVLTIALLLSLVGTAAARTKLTTLPDRETIRMDLRDPAHTLIEEERTINLQRGVNRIDFSWANVRIDKGSIQIRCTKAPERVAVLNANYPPNENALFWEVGSSKAGPAVFRISYLMSGITRKISYRAVADREEKALALDYLMTLKNGSGERLRNCRIRLGAGRDFEKSLENAESKRMLCTRFTGVPVKKVYVYDPASSGEHVRMYYRLENDREHGLGAFALEDGKARIFQIDGANTQAFLGEDWGAYTPVGSRMDLFLGLARDVTVKRYRMREERVNRRGRVHDLEREIRFEVQNFKRDAVEVDLREHPGGEWVVKSVELSEERGERDDKVRTRVEHRGLVNLVRIDTDNLVVRFRVPPTKGDLRYQLHVTLVLRNRW